MTLLVCISIRDVLTHTDFFGFAFHASFLFILAHCDNHAAENVRALEISDHHILFSPVLPGLTNLYRQLQMQVDNGSLFFSILLCKFTQKLKFQSLSTHPHADEKSGGVSKSPEIPD